MRGLHSCIGTCWQHHGNHSNCLASVSRRAQCRSCYVGYWFFTCYPGSFIVCVSCGSQGTGPSCTLTFHSVLDDFEGQAMERGGDDYDKVSEIVLILWKPGGVKLSMRLVSVIKSNFINLQPLITVILFIDPRLFFSQTLEAFTN